MNTYYIYILLCDNNTYYTGITTDISRRFNEHKTKLCGAKYTKSHQPVKIVALWKTTEGRSVASKIEYKIKSLTRQEKEFLINHPENITDYLKTDLSVENCFV